MSDKEKRNAIPVEGTVNNAKPEVKKEGFFQKLGRKAKQFAAKPAVKKVAKVGLNCLMAAGLIGLGWVARDVAGNDDSKEPEETVVLTEGDYEQSSEETDAEENE